MVDLSQLAVMNIKRILRTPYYNAAHIFPVSVNAVLTFIWRLWRSKSVELTSKQCLLLTGSAVSLSHRKLCFTSLLLYYCITSLSRDGKLHCFFFIAIHCGIKRRMIDRFPNKKLFFQHSFEVHDVQTSLNRHPRWRIA